MTPSISQYPETGKHLLRYCGDTLEVRLRGDSKITGTAFLSTNIGNASLHRKEIMEQVESRIAAGGQDWTNIPMQRVDEYTFAIRLALNETGHFECKTCLVPDEDSQPVWAPGDNVHINVVSAAYCCANSIYCAFTRQFGSNCTKAASELPGGITSDSLNLFDSNNFALIPPSGTFRDLIRRLDHIVGRLKCRILHLLPVNPTPTVYGRMGRFGSPYASLDFTAVDPALAEFDKSATPLDQFLELVDAVHARAAKIFIDIAINHTGWASKLQEEHPEWFVRESNGEFHSPGAWGVTWGDLVELDHKQSDLREYLANVFLTWCERGVDGFRCDAGYMIPVPAWEYIIAKVRKSYPDTVFLLEGLGGDPAVTSALLDMANMDWAYSELFQNYSRQQVEGYLQYAWRQSAADGILVHYAETHDNSRLAAVSEKYARMRTALSALASVSGSFGFANGVEWFAKERIDVHEASALNWGAPVNQTALIARLNALLAVHSAFHDGAMLQILDSGSPDAVVILREDAANTDSLIVCVNLNCDKKAVAVWDSSYVTLDHEEYTDLISGREIQVLSREHRRRSVTLPPGGFFCLSGKDEYLKRIDDTLKDALPAPEHLIRQEASAMVLAVLCAIRGSNVLNDENISALADSLLASPEEFLKKAGNNGEEILYIPWDFPSDARRDVMLPPDHCLLVTAPMRFRATLAGYTTGAILNRTDAVRDASGRYFVLIPPREVPKYHTRLTLTVRASDGTRTRCEKGNLLLLTEDMPLANVSYSRLEIYNRKRTFLQGNGRGAIIHQPMELGRLDSRYDAILLANLNGSYPEDRHIMFRRIRIWIVYLARFQELKHEYIASFRISGDGGGVWHYHCPVGNGLFVELSVKMQIVPGKNAVLVSVTRDSAPAAKRLPDNTLVRVLLRPDIDDRNFHNETKASSGPEQNWPNAVKSGRMGFDFAPAPNRVLHMQSSRGQFKDAPEWTYMLYQQNESARGLDPYSDVFSPGFFRFYLAGGETTWISAQVLTSPDEEKLPPAPLFDIPVPDASPKVEDVMLHSMRQFVVKRDALKTVIAGYPWFLDWGRDTLIAARGLLAAPEFRDSVADILVQFASYADAGTIPNMISGGNASNRDTSDAPLWLFRAVADYCAVTGSKDFLSRRVRGNETMFDILSSLADAYRDGARNGIRMDADSALIFSPAHFTWMDTNYPAGTPREGYPVEIQALWYSALKFLAEYEPDPAKRAARAALAERVRSSVLRYFRSPERGYLSDCLHAKSGISASRAVADDHLRPNQLLAVTLGLIDNPEIQKSILHETLPLLIPGAVRTLADRPVSVPIPVRGAGNTLLNDPVHPYQGHYEGDEDTRRKVAYHNGTAWPWLFPSWAEAWYLAYGKFGRRTAVSVLSTMTHLMDGGCITQLPEILDGDAPHTARGCDAQAWSVTEFYRVWTLLHRKPL